MHAGNVGWQSKWDSENAVKRFKLLNMEERCAREDGMLGLGWASYNWVPVQCWKQGRSFGIGWKDGYFLITGCRRDLCDCSPHLWDLRNPQRQIPLVLSCPSFNKHFEGFSELWAAQIKLDFYADKLCKLKVNCVQTLCNQVCKLCAIRAIGWPEDC